MENDNLNWDNPNPLDYRYIQWICDEYMKRLEQVSLLANLRTEEFYDYQSVWGSAPKIYCGSGNYESSVPLNLKMNLSKLSTFYSPREVLEVFRDYWYGNGGIAVYNGSMTEIDERYQQIVDANALDTESEYNEFLRLCALIKPLDDRMDEMYQADNECVEADQRFWEIYLYPIYEQISQESEKETPDQSVIDELYNQANQIYDTQYTPYMQPYWDERDEAYTKYHNAYEAFYETNPDFDEDFEAVQNALIDKKSAAAQQINDEKIEFLEGFLRTHEIRYGYEELGTDVSNIPANVYWNGAFQPALIPTTGMGTPLNFSTECTVAALRYNWENRNFPGSYNSDFKTVFDVFASEYPGITDGYYSNHGYCVRGQTLCDRHVNKMTGIGYLVSGQNTVQSFMVPANSKYISSDVKNFFRYTHSVLSYMTHFVDPGTEIEIGYRGFFKSSTSSCWNYGSNAYISYTAGDGTRMVHTGDGSYRSVPESGFNINNYPYPLTSNQMRLGGARIGAWSAPILNENWKKAQWNEGESNGGFGFSCSFGYNNNAVGIVDLYMDMSAVKSIYIVSNNLPFERHVSVEFVFRIDNVYSGPRTGSDGLSYNINNFPYALVYKRVDVVIPPAGFDWNGDWQRGRVEITAEMLGLGEMDYGDSYELIPFRTWPKNTRWSVLKTKIVPNVNYALRG